MGQKRKLLETADKEDSEIIEKGKIIIPLSPRKDEKRLIVVLEKANLESVKIGKTHELMNSKDHSGFIKKFNKDPKNYRPDILHNSLLMLQDSPLNQAGFLQVYIHTEKDVVIQVHPKCRIPRTYQRFAGLMVQLLHRLTVKDKDSDMKLLKVINGPLEDHFPVGCKIIGTSFNSKNLVNPEELIPEDDILVVVIGAMSHGKVETNYIQEEYSFSKYHLSSSTTCEMICSAFERVWHIG